MKRFMRHVGLVSLICLAACASPARKDMMVANSLAPDAAQQLETSPLKAQVQLTSVTGGRDTNPLLASQVDNPAFQGALHASLEKLGLQGNINARYALSAQLMSLAQPMMGFDMTVTSTVLYTLKDTSSGATVYNQHTVTPFTASFSDSPIGTERLKKANEGSIRMNIETALADMVRKIRTAPASQSAAATPTS